MKAQKKRSACEEVVVLEPTKDGFTVNMARMFLLNEERRQKEELPQPAFGLRWMHDLSFRDLSLIAEGGVIQSPVLLAGISWICFNLRPDRFYLAKGPKESDSLLPPPHGWAKPGIFLGGRAAFCPFYRFGKTPRGYRKGQGILLGADARAHCIKPWDLEGEDLQVTSAEKLEGLGPDPERTVSATFEIRDSSKGVLEKWLVTPGSLLPDLLLGHLSKHRLSSKKGQNQENGSDDKVVRADALHLKILQKAIFFPGIFWAQR